jgi:hypothetical protein
MAEVGGAGSKTGTTPAASGGDGAAVAAAEALAGELRLAVDAATAHALAAGVERDTDRGARVRAEAELV